MSTFKIKQSTTDYVVSCNASSNASLVVALDDNPNNMEVKPQQWVFIAVGSNFKLRNTVSTNVYLKASGNSVVGDIDSNNATEWVFELQNSPVLPNEPLRWKIKTSGGLYVSIDNNDLKLHPTTATEFHVFDSTRHPLI